VRPCAVGRFTGDRDAGDDMTKDDRLASDTAGVRLQRHVRRGAPFVSVANKPMRREPRAVGLETARGCARLVRCAADRDALCCEHHRILA
jgi:hypothetical protein